MGASNLLRIIWEALSAVEKDQQFLHTVSKGTYRRHPAVAVLLINDGIRAAFMMRLAAGGGLLGRLTRTLLLSWFGCDVSAGARIAGGLNIPHPVGIVIGSGVRLEAGVTVYQHVTLGANGAGEYPMISRGARVFPNSIIVGGVHVGENARVAAGSFVDVDVPANSTYVAR